MAEPKPSFSVRHPFLFGVLLLVLAVALFSGAMAIFGSGQVGTLRAETQIGLVNVEGLIADPDAVLKFMAELESDDNVQGVVVRLNTPGGVVAPSQELYQAVLRLRQKKPVVASMGAVAASGGYYVAAAADRIVANPGTLTGSIGVKLEMLTLRGLADKLGISQTQLTTGDFKGAGTPFRQLSSKERRYFQALIDDMHDQFVADVAEGRGLDVERVRTVADGRALTGRQALELGLVDEMGGLRGALERCKTLAGLDGQDVMIREGPQKDVPFLRTLLSGGAEEFLRVFLSESAQPSAQAVGPRWQLMY